MASRERKIIVTAEEYANTLAEAKAACAQELKANEDFRWWAEGPKGSVVRFDWDNVRSGANGTQWVSVYCTINGVESRQVIRAMGEKHVGMINPNSEAEVAKMQQEYPKHSFKKRDRTPSLQIQKWTCSVPTEQDGLTVKKDAEGKEMFPGDEFLSQYFRAADLYDEAFNGEVRYQMGKGKITEAGGRRRGPSGAAAAGTIKASNTKIASIVQMIISEKAKANAGMYLPNPMTRLPMPFDDKTGRPKVKFFDKDKPFTTSGRTGYEAAKVNGVPITADNIHRWVVSRTVHDFIANWDSVCFSNMAISTPVKCEILVTSQPESHEHDLGDLYGGDFGAATTPGEEKTEELALTTPGAMAMAQPADSLQAPGMSALARNVSTAPPPAATSMAEAAPASEDAAAVEDILNDLNLGEQ